MGKSYKKRLMKYPSQGCDNCRQLQAELDEFQKRLTYIQNGHNPYAEIEQRKVERGMAIKYIGKWSRKVGLLQAENENLKKYFSKYIRWIRTRGLEFEAKEGNKYAEQALKGGE